MKKLKQILSVLAALVLVVGMTFSSVFAADNNGSITISNAVKDASYSIYQIFKLESYNAEANQYSYTVKPDWVNFIENGEGSNYVELDNGYVKWIAATDRNTAAEFAAAALAYAKTKKEDGATPKISPTDTVVAEGTSVTFSGLELGYYLVDTTTGTLLSLTTTNPDAEAKEKNPTPSVDKKVQEDFDGIWGEKNDADLGQTVNFETTITAYKGGTNYVLHDTMTGLTLDEGSVKVFVQDVTGKRTPLTTDYYIVSTTDLDDSCDFHVAFTQEYLNTITDTTTLVVTYSATVNKDAVIRKDGNPNETWIKYGENNDLESDHDSTKTFVWDFNVFKYTGTDKTPLADVVFELKTGEDANSESLKFTLVTSGEDAGKNVYKLDPNGSATITTDATGRFTFSGLDADTYYLHEISAPDGYNKLTAPIKVRIDSNGNVYLGDSDSEGNQTPAQGNTAEIENKTGSELPETGGMGTTYLYLAGGLLVIGSAVLFIVRKRMSVE